MFQWFFYILLKTQPNLTAKAKHNTSMILFIVSIINFYLFTPVKTVNLTWSAAQLKQNMKDDDIKATDKGLHRCSQEDDARMDVRKTKKK